MAYGKLEEATFTLLKNLLSRYECFTNISYHQLSPAPLVIPGVSVVSSECFSALYIYSQSSRENKDKFITRNVSVNQKLNLIKALAQVVS